MGEVRPVANVQAVYSMIIDVQPDVKSDELVD